MTTLRQYRCLDKPAKGKAYRSLVDAAEELQRRASEMLVQDAVDRLLELYPDVTRVTMSLTRSPRRDAVVCLQTIYGPGSHVLAEGSCATRLDVVGEDRHASVCETLRSAAELSTPWSLFTAANPGEAGNIALALADLSARQDDPLSTTCFVVPPDHPVIGSFTLRELQALAITAGELGNNRDADADGGLSSYQLQLASRAYRELVATDS